MICSSVSHLTIDFEDILKYGISGIYKNVLDAFEKYKGTDKQAFVQSALICLDAFNIWHGRYLKALKCREEYKENYKNLLNVPNNPAKNFYEAVQSIWFIFAFVRLCGNWPGIGRIDYLLGDYLKNDLKNGIITLDEAREILAHFFIKGCEWVSGGNYISGDAQHYQNIVLAGIDENGNDVTNEVTYLVLDILEEFNIGDFPTTVRLSKNTDERLINRVSEVIRYGGGVLAIYNEDLIIDSLTDYGYKLCEARKFANDGCWEVQIPGKTNFTYVPFDALQILQKETLKGYEANLYFADFDSLYAEFVKDLRLNIEQITDAKSRNFKINSPETNTFIWKPNTPCTVISIFEVGCIEKGLSYYEGGAIYNVVSPHIGGLADVADSLYAIKKLVYEEKKITLSELMTILHNNWENEEALRQYALNRYNYYGNDNDECDNIAARILDDFADICNMQNGKNGYKFPAGVSTFGRQLEWIPGRNATPHGHKKGEILAGNCSPTPGSGKEGVTAIIRSYCKADMRKMTTGAALDVKLLPSNVKGENGLLAVTSLLRGFVSLGGYFMQLDVADAEILHKAQEHPEDYQTLSVRVSGWNARFVTLSREWQQMIIDQTEK